MASAKFLALLADPKANNVYLLTLTGYDPALATLRSFYHGDAGASGAYISGPDDTPANTIFEPTIEEIAWSEDLFGPDGEPGGRTAPAEIRVRLTNLDGRYDFYRTIDWRTATLRVGGDGFTLAEFEVVLQGHGPGGPAGVEQDEQQVTLTFRDAQYLLDKDVQENLYAGTGGLEGGPSLKDKRKPKLGGIGRNLTPDFLGHLPTATGTFLPAFRFHDGAVEAFDAAVHRFWIAGVPIEHDASFPPAAGKWHLDATNGVAWFNGALTGEVTMDAWGAAGVATLGDAVRYIGVCCGFADPAGMDTAAFTQADIDQPATVGFWRPEGGNALDLLDELCGPLLFSFGVTLAGLLTLAQFKGPQGAPVLTLGEHQIGQAGMPRQSTTPLVWRQFLGYRRCLTLQDPGRLALVYTNAVSTPTFATDTNWTKGTGWTISAGTANAAAGSASSLTQDLTLAVGQEYSITIDAVRSAGSFTVKMEGVTLVDANGGAAVAATGAVRRDFVAQGSLNQTLEFAKDSAFAGSVDNVIVLPARAEFVNVEYRTVKAEDAGIKTAIAQAGEDRRDTALDDPAAALAEAQRQFDLRKVAREIYTPSCFVHPLSLVLGQEMRIVYPRHGLAAGKDFILVGRRASLPSKRVDVTVYG